MSDNVLSGHDLERLINFWLENCGSKVSRGDCVYSRVPIGTEDRRHMYRELITILVEQNKYDSEDFTEKLANLIVDRSVNLDHGNRKKRCRETIIFFFYQKQEDEPYFSFHPSLIS